MLARGEGAVYLEVLGDMAEAHQGKNAWTSRFVPGSLCLLGEPTFGNQLAIILSAREDGPGPPSTPLQVCSTIPRPSAHSIPSAGLPRLTVLLFTKHLSTSFYVPRIGLGAGEMIPSWLLPWKKSWEGRQGKDYHKYVGAPRTVPLMEKVIMSCPVTSSRGIIWI